MRANSLSNIGGQIANTLSAWTEEAMDRKVANSIFVAVAGAAVIAFAFADVSAQTRDSLKFQTHDTKQGLSQRVEYLPKRLSWQQLRRAIGRPPDYLVLAGDGASSGSDYWVDGENDLAIAWWDNGRCGPVGFTQFSNARGGSPYWMQMDFSEHCVVNADSYPPDEPGPLPRQSCRRSPRNKHIFCR